MEILLKVNHESIPKEQETNISLFFSFPLFMNKRTKDDWYSYMYVVDGSRKQIT